MAKKRPLPPSRRSPAPASRTRPEPMTVKNPRAAGIDIHDGVHWVAVPPECDPQPVRQFGGFTVDLEAIADWLVAIGVDTVAMESTGVYWIPLYELLEKRGLRVYLVDARTVARSKAAPSPTSTTVSGFSGSIATAFWKRRSGPRTTSSFCGALSANARC